MAIFHLSRIPADRQMRFSCHLTVILKS